MIMFLWRPIMEELASALPFGGAPYTYLWVAVKHVDKAYAYNRHELGSTYLPSGLPFSEPRFYSWILLQLPLSLPQLRQHTLRVK